MSYPTTPAFAATSTNGSWEPARLHPATAWFEREVKAFDNKDITEAEFSEWFTSDLAYQRSDGQVTTGGIPAFKAYLEVFQKFADYYHEPGWCIVLDTEGGYNMVGKANLYANFIGGIGERKAQDCSGQSWDIVLPVMVHTTFKKVPGASNGEIRISRVEGFSDTGLVIQEMMKRGIIKGSS